jgi:hypothetical protein
VYTVEERTRVRQQLIDMAHSDPRIVAGAEVGSLTQTTGDRWSDLDLTFGVADAASVDEVFTDWTARLETEARAVRLFDLRSVQTLYRVFLYPGGLQVDLSLTPHAVAQMGPKFRPLFGHAFEQVSAPPLEPREVFGLCVHHALRTRFSIERGRLWSAQYFIVELRHETLSLACLHRGLPGRYARGFDDLPADLRERAAESFVRTMTVDELLRALRAGIALFRSEASDFNALAAVDPILNEVAADTIS